MAFIYVADGIDDVLAAHLNQYADAWSGVSGKGVPFNAVAVNDPINFAISARNLDPTNSRAAQFLKADGTVLFQADASGVKVSPDGTVAGVPVTVNSVQTFSALKTFTAGLQVTSGNVGIGGAPLSNIGELITGSILSGGVNQAGLSIGARSDSGATGYMSGVDAQPGTAAAAFTAAQVMGFHALNPAKGAGSTITSAYGLLVDAITNGNTNNYGVYITAPSGGSGQNASLLALGDVLLGTPNLATTATSGFVWLPNAAGAPTGVPSALSGYIAMRFDTSANKLWAYSNGTWKGVVLA